MPNKLGKDYWGKTRADCHIVDFYMDLLSSLKKASCCQMPIADHLGNGKAHSTISVHITDLEK